MLRVGLSTRTILVTFTQLSIKFYLNQQLTFQLKPEKVYDDMIKEESIHRQPFQYDPSYNLFRLGHQAKKLYLLSSVKYGGTLVAMNSTDN